METDAKVILETWKDRDTVVQIYDTLHFTHRIRDAADNAVEIEKNTLLSSWSRYIRQGRRKQPIPLLELEHISKKPVFQWTKGVPFCLCWRSLPKR
jgi:hypothetical protein